MSLIDPEPIWVTVSEKTYPIWVGQNLIQRPSCLAPYLIGKQVFILSNPEIAAHFLEPLIDTCREAGCTQIDYLCLPPGEQSKTLSSANKIWSFLLAHYYHRDMTFIALGGGVIGDLGGFAAACYLRGVNLIQCPTSLLAQIDAAIGGKTAVNHRRAKNMIGAFYQPSAVIIDLATLITLDEREFTSGLAELIKYGVALDHHFFTWLESHLCKIKARDPMALEQAIKWACQIKAKVVIQDATDQNLRMILNFGHTVAHALESLLDYQQLLHGEAVAIGMVVAAHLSVLLGGFSNECLEKIILLLQAAKLPTYLPPGITVRQIWSKMKNDKKHQRQQLQWVLLKALGEAFICKEVARKQIVTALIRCGAKA